ncbi:MAG TPA: molybdopterin converting factor subunit 1 [Devosiaceae bacterium]|jgi:molybdopterin synthase sulfur carrier subunit|nr:molybdopterin converting factor subunit 1 [Devosiaceae bacterium]
MKVLYFAWLRERLNRGEDDVDPPAEVATVADLIAWLAANDEAAALAMANPKIIRAAVDTEIVPHDAPIAGAKVVALFPPMTGG